MMACIKLVRYFVSVLLLIGGCSAQFYVLGLFTLTNCENDYTCNNARLNEERMRKEHNRNPLLRDVQILCTKDVRNSPDILYNVLLKIILDGQYLNVDNFCIDQTVKGSIDVKQLLIFTYMSFELTKIASSILLPFNMILLSMTDHPMYPAYYLEHHFSYYSYQSSFGEEIHKTLLDRFFKRYNVTNVAILNLEEKQEDYQCMNNNNKDLSAFCLYSTAEHQSGCYKEKYVDTSKKNDVNETVKQLIARNYSFIILSGQSHKLQMFSQKANVELYTGSPFYLGFVKTLRDENFTAPVSRGYGYSDVLINFAGDFSINQFFQYIYYGSSILLHDAVVWDTVIQNKKVITYLDPYIKPAYYLIKLYNPSYKQGDPITFNVWKNIPNYFRNNLLKELFKRKEFLISLLDLGKSRAYVDQVNLNDLRNQLYFNPESAIKNTKQCSETKPFCSPGYQLSHSYYKETGWDRSYGWHCERCSKGFYKSELGNQKCIFCTYPLQVDTNQTRCFDPYKLVYIEADSGFGVVLITFSCILVVIILSTIGIFIRKRNTPIVLSSNRTMALIQLLFHAVLTVLPVFLFVGKPDKELCLLRPISIGVFLSVIVAVNISKTQKLVLIFRSRVRLTGGDKWFIKTAEWFIIFLVIVMDVAVLLISYISYLSESSTVNIQFIYDDWKLDKQIYCNNNDVVVIQLVFTMCLVLCNGIQGFRARVLPSHYKETTHVIYSSFMSVIILVAAIGMYFGQSDVILKEMVLVFAIMVFNAIHFFLLYLYKLFVMIFRPHRNTRKAFTEERKEKLNKHFND